MMNQQQAQQQQMQNLQIKQDMLEVQNFLHHQQQQQQIMALAAAASTTSPQSLTTPSIEANQSLQLMSTPAPNTASCNAELSTSDSSKKDPRASE